MNDGSTMKSEHIKRVERVSDYIREHLDQPLDLDHLAEVACLSRFHWHRVYRGLTGETIWQTVRRLRLNRAAFELSNSDDDLKAIALKAGYAHQRAFAHAFRQDYGLSPLKYRAEGGHRRYDNPDWQENRAMYDVRFSDEKPATIIGLEHKGPYIEINATFARLPGALAALGPDVPKTTAMVGVYFDDPDITPPADLRSLAGMVLAEGESVPDGFALFDMPGGRYAILTHKGPYSELHKAYAFFYGKWLADADAKPRAFPPVERYLNTPMDTAPKDLLTEIMMPVE